MPSAASSMAATWCGTSSFAVKPGDILCLLGPSGCGKSTVLRTIAGIERQAAGRIVADGQVLSDGMLHLPPERRGIGLIFQDFALFPHLSVGQKRGLRPQREPFRGAGSGSTRFWRASI